MRHTTWVILISLLLAGLGLPGSAQDGCVDVEGDEGLMCGVLLHSGTVVMTADVPLGSTGQVRIPAPEFDPFDPPPQSIRPSA
jgi:hypothetical protein